jgi:hypothetical protein
MQANQGTNETNLVGKKWNDSTDWRNIVVGNFISQLVYSRHEVVHSASSNIFHVIYRVVD